MTTAATKAAHMRLLAHPMRIDILRLLRETSANGAGVSPGRAATALGCPLGSVCYHFQRLLKAEAIRLVKVVPKRGALEHVYALTKTGESLLAMFDLL